MRPDTIHTELTLGGVTLRWTPRMEAVCFCVAAVVTALSAIAVKETGWLAPLAAVEPTARADEAFEEEAETSVVAPGERGGEAVAAEASGGVVRFFNGRPIRPSGTIRMRVTAYSPDAASCGSFADGQTATLHSVTTNGGKLVAADTSLLAFGTLLSVPGYDEGRVVPVLDRGGAIKGRRLDVLFPTHREALEWGVRDLEITIWEYADGKPPDDPRRLR